MLIKHVEVYNTYPKIALFLYWIYTEICLSLRQEDIMRKALMCGLIGIFNITS